MKKNICILTGFLAISLVVAFRPTAVAQHVAIASKPKGIFFEEPTTPVKSLDQRIAVRFWVELHPRSGATSRIVTADHAFHNFDRTRFRAATNIECYVYVAFHGSSGQRALLFPSIRAGRDNRVRRHEPKTMPSTRGYFTFDDHPGKENVVIVLSSDRVPELETIAARRVSATATTTSIVLTPEESRIWSDLQKKWTGQPEGASTRNVLYEVDNSGPQVGSYYAQPTAFTKPVVINVTLKHEK